MSWTSSYSIWQQRITRVSFWLWVLWFVFFFLCFSLHKLFGKSIFFSRWNLFHMKSCGFNDSLDIHTFIRIYFPFNKCFDVVGMFSMFYAYIFMITPLQLSGRPKTAALHNFCQKEEALFLLSPCRLVHSVR